LLGNGFHGLRLYRNAGPAPQGQNPLVLGDWHVIGPFDNPGMTGFDRVYPPEKEINLQAKYPGKAGEVAWQKKEFPDGQVNNLAIFPQNDNAVCYLYREIESSQPLKLPVSLGSDDTLTVWLNGKKLLAQNVYRAAAADQEFVTLDLRAGKNQLLLKICQGG